MTHAFREAGEKNGWQFPELLQGLRGSWKFQLYFHSHVWGVALSTTELGSEGGISLRLEWWIIWVTLLIAAGFFIQMKWFKWVKLEQSLSEKSHHVVSVRKQISDIIIWCNLLFIQYFVFFFSGMVMWCECRGKILSSSSLWPVTKCLLVVMPQSRNASLSSCCIFMGTTQYGHCVEVLHLLLLELLRGVLHIPAAHGSLCWLMTHHALTDLTECHQLL